MRTKLCAEHGSMTAYKISKILVQLDLMSV